MSGAFGSVFADCPQADCPQSTKRGGRHLHRLEICEIPTYLSQIRFTEASQMIALFRRLKVCNPSQEEFWVVSIDPIGRAVSASRVATGSIDELSVDIPDVLKFVIASNAHRFVAIHNHPQGLVNGRCGVSREDMYLTRRLMQAADVTGLEMLDHIVWCGGDNYFSFFDEDRLG